MTTFGLIEDMRETPALMRGFDPAPMRDWAAQIGAAARVFITGEGSSRIFPAKNMIDLARRHDHPWVLATEGARQAAEYPLDGWTLVGASNSGRTRELIALFEQHPGSFGITSTAQSPLTRTAAQGHVLSNGGEKAVAATKSVVEMALCYQALLDAALCTQRSRAADAMENILSTTPPQQIIDTLSAATQIYFAGRNNGVAEELRLKCNEITRKKSDYLEGTYALHGIEEVMTAQETVILIEPFQQEIEKYQAVLEKGAGVQVLALSSAPTPFPTLHIPAVENFNGYLQLAAGWTVLAATGIACGIDIDTPKRARKVGNSV